MRNICVLTMLICFSFGYSQTEEISRFKSEYLSNNCGVPEGIKNIHLKKKRAQESIALMNKIESLDKRDFYEYIDFMFNLIPFAFNSWNCGALSDYNIFNQLRFDAMLEDKVQFEFVTGTNSRTIAQAHSPAIGDVRFIINVDKWENLNNYERLWVLMHEFGHEGFELSHSKGGALMYPLLPEDLKQTYRSKEYERHLINFLDLKITESESPLKLHSIEKDVLAQGYPFNFSNKSKYPGLITSELPFAFANINAPSNKAFNVLMEASFEFLEYLSNASKFSDGLILKVDYSENASTFDRTTKNKELVIPYVINYVRFKFYSTASN